MIGCGGAEFGGKRSAGTGAELFGMKTKAEAVAFRAFKDLSGLLYSEGVVVAERIAVSRKTGCRDFGDQFFGDPGNVFGAAIGELRRNGVRGQKRGNDAHRAFAFKRAITRSMLKFSFAIKAVAGLGFERRGAAAQHPVAIAMRAGEQFVFAGGAS